VLSEVDVLLHGHTLHLGQGQSVSVSYSVAQSLNSFPGADGGRLNYLVGVPDRSLDETGYTEAVSNVRELLTKEWLNGRDIVLEVSQADRGALSEAFGKNQSRIRFTNRVEGQTAIDLNDAAGIVGRISRSREGLALLQNSIIALPDGSVGFEFIPAQLRDTIHVVKLAELLAGPVASANLGLMMAIYEVVQKHA